jgi:isoquinoline 1-oxidoreductase alpha subunit
VPRYTFTLNGRQVDVDAPGDLSVLWALRDKLGVTGPKYGCGIDVCKACTSHLDGEAFNPCVTNVRDVAGREVTTIEGLADGDRLHPVQEAWLEQDVAQCGYCQPGQIMAAVALLRRTLNPSDADIDEIQNVCRCGTYVRIREAIKSAAAKLRAQPVVPAGRSSTATPVLAGAALAASLAALGAASSAAGPPVEAATP